MATLHLETNLSKAAGHEGEVLACAYMPDNSYLMTAGWDGTLCLWDTKQATVVETFEIDDKPVSACCVSPDNKRWLIGTMDGFLGQWDAEARIQTSIFLAHTRPISNLTYSPDGHCFASASWDRTIHLWETDYHNPSPPLGSHGDIVSGCSFTPDGKKLLSWSYDGTAVDWDMHNREPAATMEGHDDRITAGAVSPDGQWLVTGGRDGEVKLWELQYGQEVSSLPLLIEIRSCLFLLDNESIVVADAAGRLVTLQLPHLRVVEEDHTDKAIQSAALAPSGLQIALGDTDGRVFFVSVGGLDSEPLAVTATQSIQDTSRMFHRLLGKNRHSVVFDCTCPVCRASIQLTDEQISKVAYCPQCQRAVRVCAVVETAGAVMS